MKQLQGYLLLAVSWVGNAIGHFIHDIELSQVALLLTVALTAVQLYVTIRDKLLRRQRRRKYEDDDYFL